MHDFLVSIEDVNGGSSRCLNDVGDVKRDAGDGNEKAEEVADIVGNRGGCNVGAACRSFAAATSKRAAVSSAWSLSNS